MFRIINSAQQVLHLFFMKLFIRVEINGFMQKRQNFIANALELCLFSWSHRNVLNHSIFCQTSLQVPAPCAGIIEEFLVEDGTTVTAHMPIFKIKVTGKLEQQCCWNASNMSEIKLVRQKFSHFIWKGVEHLQRCQPLLILLYHYSFWHCRSPFLLNISKENQEN